MTVNASDTINDAVLRIQGREAILQKLADVMQDFEAPGVNHVLEQQFWRGVGDLTRATRDDLEAIKAAGNEPASAQ